MPRPYTHINHQLAQLNPHLPLTRLPREKRAELSRGAESLGIELGRIEREIIQPYRNDGVDEDQCRKLLHYGMQRYFMKHRSYWAARFQEVEGMINDLPLSPMARTSVHQTFLQMVQTTAMEVREMPEPDYDELFSRLTKSYGWAERIRQTPTAFSQSTGR